MIKLVQVRDAFEQAIQSIEHRQQAIHPTARLAARSGQLLQMIEHLAAHLAFESVAPHHRRLLPLRIHHQQRSVLVRPTIRIAGK